MRTSLDPITVMAARVEFEAGDLVTDPIAFHVTIDLAALRALYLRAWRAAGGKATEIGGAITVERREPSR